MAVLSPLPANLFQGRLNPVSEASRRQLLLADLTTSPIEFYDMDWDERAEVYHRAISLAWSGRFNDVRGPPIAKWVSTFRNGQLCEVVGDNCGSFNWTCQIRFKDGLQWMIRFAVPGRAIDGDEKVRHEVATMQFIRTETKIPVPSVLAWGMAKDNPLGLGAFIIMDFIEGEPLGKILEVLPEPESGQTLREDISDRDLDIIYRQIANILLELSEHDFPRIGSLSRIDNDTCVDSRPLTLKMNETERHGGVKISNDVSRTFSSATEYFHHVAEQDLQHLCKQPNSIDDIHDARSKYIHRSIFKAMLPRFVSDKHNHGPFKLICDDFRFGNILVSNATDLKIVAVVDWEWAYAAPYQMLYSPPRWLLIKKPIRWDDEDSPIPYLSQYKSYFQKFVRVLKEEESKRERDVALATSKNERMSSLMQQSMDDGKFWFHELVYSSFESADNPAWAAIREIIPNLNEFGTVTDTELNAFVEGKMEQLRQYDLEWGIMKEDIDKKNAQFEALKEKVEREDKELKRT